MRLDKYIAHATGLPRRIVKYHLRGDRVSVNNQSLRDGALKLAADDVVCLDGQPLALPGARYLMLNKPPGVVCAHRDGAHPSIFDALAQGESLQAAGRLDMDTTGLVLLTDDGQWNHRATSPNVGKRKRYRVWTCEPIEQTQIDAFAQGILLRGEPKHCRPAQLTPQGEREALLDISEGKYHQVKRMFAAVGNKVERLHRLAIGQIALDPNLQPGEYRDLTADEIASI